MASPLMNGDATGRDGPGVDVERKEKRSEKGKAVSRANEQKGENEQGKNKTSKTAELWGKLGLDLGTGLMMMKAALPPTIALAMYQSTDVAETYTTFGYLMAVISIYGFCIMPRAIFMQTMTFNVMGTCIGAAVGMLMVWSGVKAREHTTPAGQPPQLYNSSQSAVCGVWLFFQIWLVNSIKVRFPQFAIPTILYAIFVNVAATSGPRLLTTAQAESFVKRLLYSFLTGLALGTGVSLFIFPITCRTVVRKQMTGYITALRGALQAHKAYFQMMETADIIDHPTSKEDGDKKKAPQRSEVEALKKLCATITELHGKLHSDIPFAKRETAYGKLTPDDFEGIFKHLREIMMPMVGMASLVDLVKRQSELNHWDGHKVNNAQEAETEHIKMVEELNEIMQAAHEHFAAIIQAMDQGLEHVLLRLQFVKPPKKKKSSERTDPEARGDLVQAGDPGFADYLENQCDVFYRGKSTTFRQWIESKGVKLRDNFCEGSNSHTNPQFIEITKQPTYVRNYNQRQIYVLLYIVFLLNSIARATLEFVRFADKRDQAVVKSKLIVPGKRRFRKWVTRIFKVPDANRNDDATVAGVGGNYPILFFDPVFNMKKDPEHLPPENAWENFGNIIRAVSHFLQSPESSFGFRCACATMSIAIIAYLRDTQQFFIEQRLVWAMIMVALSMTPTAGHNYFGFFLRILGTIVAMLVSFLVWYIPNQETPGVIVFVWVFLSILFYIPLKRMDLIIVGLISCVTTVIIVGYELEVRKIGREAATSNGQPYYPMYLLAPYRLVTVIGGLAVAFIWTFFPFPINESSALRQNLGAALYVSSNYYSIVHETVIARLRDDGDPTDASSLGYQLAKSRNKVFAKQMLLIEGLKTHSMFMKWEVPLGGKFPRKAYEEIIKYVTNITNYTALLSYASNTFTSTSHLSTPNHAHWRTNLRKIIQSTELTSHEITFLLALLSSSITNGQPLPPYLQRPGSYQLSRRLEAVDRDILSIRHIGEEGYAAVAVLQVATGCINMDLERLLKAVKRLVGELDFSSHVVSTQNSSGETGSDDV